jgi:Na+-transporting methylmalonyl-CoA/oxaloacetate decarboxylase gamma subunit
MSEGLTVIAAGLLVVLCIILSMLLFIEVILKFDRVLSAREERASSLEEGTQPEAVTAGPPVLRKGDEVIAAIGLALHRHLSTRIAPSRSAAQGGSGPAPWASSGRLRIMMERQRVTSRRG